MDVEPTNQHQLRNAVMLIRSKISEKCFQRLAKSMPQRISSKEKGIIHGIRKVHQIK